jgi:hypothetical protein
VLRGQAGSDLRRGVAGRPGLEVRVLEAPRLDADLVLPFEHAREHRPPVGPGVLRPPRIPAVVSSGKALERVPHLPPGTVLSVRLRSRRILALRLGGALEIDLHARPGDRLPVGSAHDDLDPRPHPQDELEVLHRLSRADLDPLVRKALVIGMLHRDGVRASTGHFRQVEPAVDVGRHSSRAARAVAEDVAERVPHRILVLGDAGVGLEVDDGRQRDAGPAHSRPAPVDDLTRDLRSAVEREVVVAAGDGDVGEVIRRVS